MMEEKGQKIQVQDCWDENLWHDYMAHRDLIRWQDLLWLRPGTKYRIVHIGENYISETRIIGGG